MRVTHKSSNSANRIGKSPCQLCLNYTASKLVAYFGDTKGAATVGADCMRKIKAAGAEGVLVDGPGSVRLFHTKEYALAAGQ